MARVDDVDLRTLEVARPAPVEATSTMSTSTVRTLGAVCTVCGKTLPLSAAEWNQTRIVAGKRVHGACAPPWAKHTPDANIDASAAPPTLVIEAMECTVTVNRDMRGRHVDDVVKAKATGGAAKDLADAHHSGRRILFKFTKGGAVIVAIDGVIAQLASSAGFGVFVVDVEIRGQALP